MRYAIIYQTWAIMGPMVECCKSHLRPAPELPDRIFFEALPYWARVGCPWHPLPAVFGDY